MNALKLYCEIGGTRKFIGEAQTPEQCAELIIGDSRTRFTVPKNLNGLEFRKNGRFTANPGMENSPVYVLEE